MSFKRSVRSAQSAAPHENLFAISPDSLEFDKTGDFPSKEFHSKNYQSFDASQGKSKLPKDFRVYSRTPDINNRASDHQRKLELRRENKRKHSKSVEYDFVSKDIVRLFNKLIEEQEELKKKLLNHENLIKRMKVENYTNVPNHEKDSQAGKCSNENQSLHEVTSDVKNTGNMMTFRLGES